MADRATKTKTDILNEPVEVSVVADVGGSPTYATRLDEASSTVTYVGKADTGSSNASAVWQIQKVDTSSGLSITWADGDALFDNVWNNRASLSYS